MPNKIHKNKFRSLIPANRAVSFISKSFLSILLILFLSAVTLTRTNFKDVETDFLKLEFDSKTGEITFVILDREKKPVQQVKLPPISLNGAFQNNFQDIESKNRAFQNLSLRLEFEVLSPRAVAVTWTTLDNRVQPFEVKIADSSNYFGGGERFQAINQKGFILPMASQNHPEDKGATTYKPVPERLKNLLRL